MQRITKADLHRQADHLNRLTGSPAEMHRPERRADGSLSANPGHYYIDHAYGGVELERICSDGHGSTTPLNTGHIPKRELHGLLRAFIRGIEAGHCRSGSGI